MFQAKKRDGIWYIYCETTRLWSGAQGGSAYAHGAANMLNGYHAKVLRRVQSLAIQASVAADYHRNHGKRAA